MHPGTPTRTFESHSGDGAPASETRSSEQSDEHFPLDETDTRNILWHLQSALEDAECIRGRPILEMGITRDLRHAKRLLQEHAERNGFDL